MRGTGKKTRKTIILALVSFGIALLLMLSGALDVFELKAYDLFSRNLNPESGDKNIVIVEIDQQSIDALSKQGIRWPWPRQIYAPIIEYLKEADAVFMDMFFLEPSSYGVEDDSILAAAVKKASNVYLAFSLTNNKTHMPKTADKLLERISIKEKIPAGLTYKSINMPLKALMSSIMGGGNVTIPPDADGVYRSVPLVFRAGDYTIPHFVMNYLLQKGIVRIRDGNLYLHGSRIHLLDGKLLLRYYTGDRAFMRIPAINILSSYNAAMESKKPLINRDFFRGKVVFIGPTAAGLYDLKPTAVSAISTGVVIHATTLDNLIKGSFLRPAPPIFTVILMLLLSSLACYFVIRHFSVLINLSFFTGCLVFVMVFYAALFKGGIYLNFIYPATSLVIGFMFAFAYSYATEGRERRFVRRAFSQYMDTRIVNHILSNPEFIKPGGQKRKITVFFTDIAGFTTLAESLPPEQTARILHTILNSFTEIIIGNGGIIDKYIGDAIMAFWGAPLKTGRDEINACRASIQCSNALDEINRSFRKDGLNEINIRIGIHTGEAIVGNLGSDRLFDFTAIGD
ncbi:MAG TPA: adenylate/guanylate cyclase domain-containing protein, partial [Nitrospirae bacterium]|nr:adenylate/guanylate cyclase domain-containing protein [Nitrospirota bacterium]